jgi:hypothetical protein
MRQNQKRNRGVAVRERAAVLGEKTESFTCCFCAVKKISAAGSLLQKHRKPRELRRRSWREKRGCLPPFIPNWTASF